MAGGDDAFRELFSRHAPWLAARHESLADRGPGPGDVDLGRVWLGVAAQVWRRRPGPAERAAARLLRSPGLARALVTTPSLLAGWLIATAVVLLAGVLARRWGPGRHTCRCWLRRSRRPASRLRLRAGHLTAWELSRSMAVSDRMVLLARALAVFAVNAALGLAAAAAGAAVVPTAAAVTFGWLIPMTAVCALALAAGDARAVS